MDRLVKEGRCILLLMTLPSTHQSPMTVNKNASVLTMGTVKLNSGEGRCHQFPTRKGKMEEARLTGLAYEQKEPHTARQVDQERQSIARVPQEVDDGKKGAVKLRLEPAALDGVGVEDRAGRGVVIPRGATDKRCGQAPGDTDEGEAEDIVEWAGLRLLGVCHDPTEEELIGVGEKSISASRQSEVDVLGFPPCEWGAAACCSDPGRGRGQGQGQGQDRAVDKDGLGHTAQSPAASLFLAKKKFHIFPPP